MELDQEARPEHHDQVYGSAVKYLLAKTGWSRHLSLTLNQ